MMLIVPFFPISHVGLEEIDLADGVIHIWDLLAHLSAGADGAVVPGAVTDQSRIGWKGEENGT
jgi:hypothetical protein